MNRKQVRDTFLNELSHYEKITSDRYTAVQWASIATQTELGITKDQLINYLNGDSK